MTIPRQSDDCLTMARKKKKKTYPLVAAWPYCPSPPSNGVQLGFAHAFQPRLTANSRVKRERVEHPVHVAAGRMGGQRDGEWGCQHDDPSRRCRPHRPLPTRRIRVRRVPPHRQQRHRGARHQPPAERRRVRDRRHPPWGGSPRVGICGRVVQRHAPHGGGRAGDEFPGKRRREVGLVRDGQAPLGARHADVRQPAGRLHRRPEPHPTHRPRRPGRPRGGPPPPPARRRGRASAGGRAPSAGGAGSPRPGCRSPWPR